MITFIIIIIFITTIITTAIIIMYNIITIIFVIAIVRSIKFLVINTLVKTVHSFYKVSCKYIFGSLSFFVFLNRIYATTTWC